MKRTIFYLLAFLPLYLFLTSCGGEEQISRDYLCRFSFNADMHPTSKIITAVKSQGYFVWVEMSRVGAVQHVLVHPADQSGDEDVVLTIAEENYISYELGAYNGIFVGCTNFNGPVAYDRQCPNCLRDFVTGNFPLVWTEQPMIVRCDKCQRTYSLETGACLQEGRRLMQYGVRLYYNEFGSVVRVTVMN